MIVLFIQYLFIFDLPFYPRMFGRMCSSIHGLLASNWLGLCTGSRNSHLPRNCKSFFMIPDVGNMHCAIFSPMNHENGESTILITIPMLLCLLFLTAAYWMCVNFLNPKCPRTSAVSSELQSGTSIFDDHVLDFLAKIKSLFTNVVICINLVGTPQKEKDLCILLDHLLPMVTSHHLTSIRGVCCKDNLVQLMNQQFPGTLESAKELKPKQAFLEPAFIPAYLDWLNAPLHYDYDQHGPRFLKIEVQLIYHTDIVGAVRQQFLKATTPATFVVFIEDYHTDEFSIENAVTKEQLVVRNAEFKMPKNKVRYYVEIVRHPMGEDAKVREWINGRAYREKQYTDGDDEEGQMIWIEYPTIGRIRKAAAGTRDQPVDGDENGESEPSTFVAKKMRK